MPFSRSLPRESGTASTGHMPVRPSPCCRVSQQERHQPYLLYCGNPPSPTSLQSVCHEMRW